MFSHIHAEEKQRIVALPAGEIIHGDYFVWGTTVEVSGEVEGDVYVAGGQIVVDGTVHGDVLAIGGSVVISGKVLGNVRIACGQLAVSGSIGRSCTLAGANIELLPSASVGGSLVAAAGNLDLAAPVGEGIRLSAGNIRLSSSVGQGVQAAVGQMRLTSKAFIGGDLLYASSEDAVIDPMATVKGEIIHKPSVVRELIGSDFFEKFLIGSRVVAHLMNFLYSLGVGILFLRLFPDNVAAAIAALKKTPVKAFGFGILVLVFLPLLFLILLMTIFGIPFALTLLGLNIITFYTAKVITVLWASNQWLTKVGFKPNKIGTLAAGLAIYFGLTLIPLIGVMIAVGAMLLGMGASLLAVKPKA